MTTYRSTILKLLLGLFALVLLSALPALAQVPVITTPSPLPDGTRSSFYSTSLFATGGAPPYTFSLDSPVLAPGLTISSAGVISGTPTSSGTFTFDIRVRDTKLETSVKTFTLTIHPPLAFTVSSLPEGVRTVPYSTTITTTGGKPPRDMFREAGSLPPGLTLDGPTGLISGTPTTAGTYSFLLVLTDSIDNSTSQSFTIIIRDALEITTATLPSGATTIPYSITLAATGGSGTRTWSVSAGSLPAGLTLNPTTGQLSGTPTAAGSFPVTIKVVDTAGASAERAFTLSIAATLVITTPSLPGGTVGTAYSTTLTATGGTLPYSWRVKSGSLPTGLTMSGTGVISGTPTAHGTFNFVAEVTDSTVATINTAEKPFSIVVSPPPLSITTTTLPGGTVGLAYSQALSASGGVSPYSWSILSGSLPGGLGLNSTTGAITGTPTAAGTFSFTARVTDNVGTTSDRALSITIVPALTITTASLPGGTVGLAYSQTLAATGGTPPYSWSILSGSLPGGLGLNSTTGAITGTPTAAGTFSFTARVTDNVGTTSDRALSITIVPALSITTTSLPGGTVGTAYSQTVVATGGTPPYIWSIPAGSVPPGTGLGVDTGVISGTPTIPGAYTLTIRVTDSVGTTAERSLSILIGAGVSITTTSLAGGTVGLAYTQTLTASGGTSPYTWSIPAGALPGGLTLNSTSGAITGTPTAAGTFSFTARVTDNTGATNDKALSITIGAALTITTSALASGVAGVGYSDSLAAAGGAAPYTWSIASGALPPGLTLNSSTGALTGTPTTTGTFGFTARVTDHGGATADKALSITIGPALSIATTSLAGGIVGTAYSQTLVAAGGAPGYSWSISSGALPTGLTLNGGTGVISGTPSTAGIFNFTARVLDSSDRTSERALSITVSSALTISTTSLPAGTRGTPYSTTLAASGGTGTGRAWSVTSGSLPPGLSLNAASGLIVGTPTTPGTFAFTVQVAEGTATATRPLSITIGEPLAITTEALPSGRVGSPYSATLTATGGTAPLTWSLDDLPLPPGLTLNATTGAITGTPTTAGTFSFIVRVTDAVGRSDTRGFMKVIAPSFSISTTSLPSGTVNQDYSATLTAVGSTTTVTWAIVSGGLPPGVTLTPSTGAITGVPTSTGLFAFSVTATSGTTTAGPVSLSITVGAAPLDFSPTALPDARRGQVYSVTFNPSGGEGSYSWRLSAGTLPPGLTFSGGRLSGTPTAEGTFNFNIFLTSGVQFIERSFTLRVLGDTRPPLLISTNELPVGTIGRSYTALIESTGGVGSVTFAVTRGALPRGLSLLPGGQISGTPEVPTEAEFEITATDTDGRTHSRTFVIRVVAPGAVIQLSAPLNTVMVGEPVDAAIAATGGQAPYTFSLVSGALPAGVTLASGFIRGTPTVPGEFRFIVRAVDALGREGTSEFQLSVLPPLALTTADMKPARLFQEYEQELSAVGGRPPYEFSVFSGTLPPGISLINGALRGTPTQSGRFTFEIRVVDDRGASVRGTYEIVVPPGPSITNSTVPNGTVGVAYSLQFEATGGRPPYAFAASGNIPPGLSLSPDGVLSGSPTSSGGFDFTVRVTDQDGLTSSRSYALAIGLPSLPPISITGPGGTTPPNGQPGIGVVITQPFPVPINGTLRLTFAADNSGPDDPAVQFSSGGRTLTFVIPAGSTQGGFSLPTTALQTGTVAGVITLTMSLEAAGQNITPSPAPATTIRVPPGPPVITRVDATRTASGFELVVSGFSTPRQMTRARVVLGAAPGSTLAQTEFTIDLQSVFNTWYSSTASFPFGSQFRLVLPFTITGATVNSATITLTNNQGDSASQTVTF